MIFVEAYRCLNYKNLCFSKRYLKQNFIFLEVYLQSNLILLYLYTGLVGNEIKSFSLPDLVYQPTSIFCKLLQSINAISIPEKNVYPVKVWWSLVELP